MKYVERIWYALCKGERYSRAHFLLATFKRPIVTVFGGTLVPKEDSWWHEAFTLGELLSRAGFGVITGGGTGIMEAALCGAFHDVKESHDLVTMGIGVVGVDEHFRSRCAQHMIHVHNFADRKHLLMRFSVGFVIFPGGLGTFDELSELLNLIKHNEIHKVPIVLVGKDFWQPYLTLFSESVAHGWIKESLSDLLVVVDNAAMALTIVRGDY